MGTIGTRGTVRKPMETIGAMETIRKPMENIGAMETVRKSMGTVMKIHENQEDTWLQVGELLGKTRRSREDLAASRWIAV